MEYNATFPLLRPYTDFDNQGFWEGIKRHQLVFQRCKHCGLFVHRPRPMCPRCLSTEKEWVPSEGKGTIYSYVTVHYEKTGYPGIKVPYSVVVVEMLEGVRIIANVEGIEPGELQIGMPVEVVFEDIAEDLTLPRFRKRLPQKEQSLP